MCGVVTFYILVRWGGNETGFNMVSTALRYTTLALWYRYLCWCGVGCGVVWCGMVPVRRTEPVHVHVLGTSTCVI